MKIAVTYDETNESIFQHFGMTPAFKLYNIEDGQITSSEVVPTGEYSHGALAGFLQNLGAEVLICGGLGMGAKMRVEGAGIKLYGGAKGDADEAVKAYLNGSLEYDPLAAEHHGPCHHHE